MRHTLDGNHPRNASHLVIVDIPVVSGVQKQGMVFCRRFRHACSTSFFSEAGSTCQKEPLPDSSWDRGTFTKYRFSERLCRIEFWR